MDRDLQQAFRDLEEIVAEVVDLERAGAVLRWDQETYMPTGGSESRAQVLGTLARLAHARFVSDAVGELLAKLKPALEELDPESYEASLIRVTAREYEKLRKLPARLVEEQARVASVAQVVWAEAREKQDFGLFQPHLERLFALAREIADHLGYPNERYDALLDLYEPGMRTAEVEHLFTALKERLLPLVGAIGEASRAGKGAVDDTFLRQPYDEAGQWELTLRALRAMGYDFSRGRQDKSAHPFTIHFSPDDVRITTRIIPDDPLSALFSSIHEGGHALYEQGIPRALSRTHLGEGASLGVHESQSRLWENVVGRSREFWQFFLPVAREVFPAQLAGVTVEQIYRAVNRVKPSFIRTEADEVTYNLHIFLRFELERAVLNGQLEVGELPAAWDDKMESYLGIRPPDLARGVLQDIHWSMGSIGYFPTYTLGNVLSVQFYRQAVQEEPEIPQAIARGELMMLKEWLRRRIHVHGAKFEPQELVRKVTGRPLDPQPYLEYIEGKYSDLYGLKMG
ncbi:MAG: carboxypeptidase M32 [Limnochordales bacterium]|nr:carboxypeptidase M32 [Limnochordales bacterium]